jgi:outer membrane protein assembly factor BamB
LTAGSDENSIAGLYSSGVFFDSLQMVRQFAAFDAQTGNLRWEIPTEGPVKMSAVEKDGLLYFGDTSGYFYVVDAASGAVKSKVKFPDIFTVSPPVIVGNTLFVACSKTVYAISLDALRAGHESEPLTPL